MAFARDISGAGVPELFSTDLGDLASRDHLLMQAALQPLVDGSISKTLTLARDVRRSAVEEIFDTAYGLKLKGCTVFRKDTRAGVLTDREPSETLPADAAECCDTQG